MTRVRVIDIESSGDAPEPDKHGIVEFGWCDVGDSGAWGVGEPHSVLLHPGRPIPPEISAIHHIIDRDVEGCPNWRDELQNLLMQEPRPDAFAAHWAKFERQWITDTWTGGLPWICTLKVAYRMWKDAPSFSNQALRYWRNPAGLDRAKASPAHRAGPDAYVTAHHLRDMLSAPGVLLEHLVKVSSKPSLLPKVTFGKHYGLKWDAVPRGYLEWVVEQKGMDEDVRFTAEHYLNAGA